MGYEPRAVSKLTSWALVIAGTAALAVRYHRNVGHAFGASSRLTSRWWPEFLVGAGVVFIVAGAVRARLQWKLEGEQLRRDAWRVQSHRRRVPDYDVRPISGWLVGAAAAIVVGVGAGTLALLLYEANNAPIADRAGLRIDAIKTTLIVSGTTSGIQALLLAARRYWMADRQRANAEARAEDEASAASVREQRDKAVEQLSSERR